MTNAIPYYRVSTRKQEQSGLGLEAQQKSVKDYAAMMGLPLLDEFIEVESGRSNNRPILQKALAACKKEGAVLLIARLDRLGRNVAFISSLMESKVQFISVDNPEAEDFVQHILASVAQKEAKDISRRTKEALQAAKERGVVLGRFGRDVLSKRNHEQADAFALKMRPIIEALNSEGHKTLRAVTAQLNKRDIAPYSGELAKWHLRSVHTLLKRIERLKNSNNQ